MSNQKVVNIDLGYKPRKFQAYLHGVLQRFSVLVCHRRFGKTYFSLRHMIDKGFKNQLENPHYAYIAPTYKQAKLVAWEYLKAFLRGVPNQKINETDLKISISRPAPFNDTITFFLLGADNEDSIRGIYLDGVIIDEFAQCPLELWGEVLRPLLADRLGWAIFIGTPKGQNHFHDMYRRARKNESGEWFGVLLKASMTGVISDAELASAKMDMTEEEFAQEMECSFTAALTGAYYGKLITNLENEGRILSIPYDPSLPVQTFWDIGMDDSTAVVFVQQIAKEKRIIDYYETNGKSLPEVIKVVKDKPYVYSRHVLPWDIEARELTTGKSRLETIRPMLSNIEVGKKLPIEDRIHAVRMVLPLCWFDINNTGELIECLKNYTKKWDSKKGMFTEKPDHNWASHGADTFGYMALFLRPDNDFDRDDLQREADSEYDFWA